MFHSRTSNTLILQLFIMFLLGSLVFSFPAPASTYRGSVSPRPQKETTPVAPDQQKATPAVTAPAKKQAAPATKATQKQSAPKKTTATKNSAKKKSAEQKAASAPAGKKSSASKKTTKAAPKASAQKPASAQKSGTKKNSAASKPKQAVQNKKQTPSASVKAGSQKTSPPAKTGSNAATKKTASKADKPAASNKNLHLNVKSALLVNMTTGKIYYEQNPDKPIAPASITKVLTLYVLRESLAQGKISWKTPIPVSSRAVATGGSSMHLNKGEKVPLSELVKGISVVSANNACVALAEYLGKGDPKVFVGQMNAKAKKIGMTKSQFKNPNGLPAQGQLSTARDIAKLSMSYLRAFPDSLSIHSLTTHSYNGVTHRNANSLLRTYPGVDGLKTGFVCSSGYNITATAKRGNTRLVAVVLGAQTAKIRQLETARLLDYGFKQAAMESGKNTATKKSTKKTK
ncbi:MAG: D-alanyl-D-alanine carboxypeptidase [Desulfovibrionales bacterium]|nr:D-alanyl-D-alanine carboxypeptidase [Desulfovibrionales bacterium]